MYLREIYGIINVQSTFLNKASDNLLESLNDFGRQRVDEYIALLSSNAKYAKTSTAPKRNGRIIKLYNSPVSAGTGLNLESDDYDEIERNMLESLNHKYAPIPLQNIDAIYVLGKVLGHKGIKTA